MTNRPSTTGWFAAMALLIAALGVVPAHVACSQPPDDAAGRATWPGGCRRRRATASARRRWRRLGAACGCQPLTPASPYPIWGVDSAGRLRLCGEGRLGCPRHDPLAGVRPGRVHRPRPYAARARVPAPRRGTVWASTSAARATRSRGRMSCRWAISCEWNRSRPAAPSPAAAQNRPQPAEDVINRELVIQPDGTITLPLLGQVRAARLTVPQLREQLEELYSKYYRMPAITVSPRSRSTPVWKDLLNTVGQPGRRAGRQAAGRGRGHASPATSSCRHWAACSSRGSRSKRPGRKSTPATPTPVPDIEVTIDLAERSKRYVYVVGRSGPAGPLRTRGPHERHAGDRPGRRLENGRESAPSGHLPPRPRLAIDGHDGRRARRALRPPAGAGPTTSGSNDSDIVLVPKTPIQQADELIEQIFTRACTASCPADVIWRNGSVVDTSSL